MSFWFFCLGVLGLRVGSDTLRMSSGVYSCALKHFSGEFVYFGCVVAEPCDGLVGVFHEVDDGV